MTITIEALDLPTPLLEFGTGETSDPKAGLTRYGPFSLRFGVAHKTQVQVGLEAFQRMQGPRALLLPVVVINEGAILRHQHIVA